MIGKAIKKQEPVEFVQWTGDNEAEVLLFCNRQAYMKQKPEQSTIRNCLSHHVRHLTIRTLEGEHFASVGDYIIKGIKGEFYPCKPDIFHATYDIEPEEAPLDEATYNTDPVKESEWISVDDQIPNKRWEWYLISSDCNMPHERLVTMAFLDSNEDGSHLWLVQNDSERCESDEWEKVTHWMPLPKPPITETE